MNKPPRLKYQIPIGLLFVNVLILMVFSAMLIHAWIRGQGLEDFANLAYGFAGVISYFFPYEVASWTGNYGWTRNQWRMQPEGWVRFTGVLLLGVGAYRLFGA